MRADTIFALSSAPGRAAISIVRISGPAALVALLALTQRSALPSPRTAFLSELQHAERRLDRALCLWFPGPNSATGEDLVELHIHGGLAVIRSVLAALGAMPGLRLAEPGEFTRRAFLHGKMDLTQAEGLADLIDAETEMQAAQALSQLDGRLGSLYESWRTVVVRALAYVEAVIDFPDEDVPDTAALTVVPDLKYVISQIDAHLADGHRGEILRDGLSVVILGAPNAGKSSLLNALARRDIAIVSDIPGTTRDVLEARLNLGGYAVNLADTAGLRETAETIETEGIRRALDRAEKAQLRLFVVGPESIGRIDDSLALRRDGDLVLFSKSDLNWPTPSIGGDVFSVSAQAGQGLDRLTNWLSQKAAELSGQGGSAVITRTRHREALQETASFLTAGIASMGMGLDVAAENFRIAARALGRITGRVDVEDVLDVVFRDFCIGK